MTSDSEGTDPSSPLPSSLSEAFQLPPILRNQRGEIRKAGFELEYSGPGVEASARLVQRIFGGEYVADDPYVHKVVGTRFGDFIVELDSGLLKQRRYEKPLRAIGIDLDKLGTGPLEKAMVGLAGLASPFVPIEIASPPIPINELEPLEDLRRLLLENQAEGTGAGLLNAYGMHINPETPVLDAATLRDFLRAFILLYPWLSKCVNVDLARRISPYVNPFPAEYGRLILAENYPAEKGTLIDDYLRYNATRNRPLDMLPILTCLDQERVRATVPEEKINPRPSFHYRMPNCLVDEPDWSLAKEWNTWVAVERLACDPDRMRMMAKDYLEAEGQWFRPFYDRWPRVLEKYMEEESH